AFIKASSAGHVGTGSRAESRSWIALAARIPISAWPLSWASSAVMYLSHRAANGEPASRLAHRGIVMTTSTDVLKDVSAQLPAADAYRYSQRTSHLVMASCASPLASLGRSRFSAERSSFSDDPLTA